MGGDGNLPEDALAPVIASPGWPAWSMDILDKINDGLPGKHLAHRSRGGG